MPKTKRQKKEELKEAVSALVLDATMEVVEEEDTERRPGKVIRGVKTPWTKKDVEAIFPPVTFIPDENIPVTYNGVRYQLFADIETTVPSIIKQIYDDYKAAKRRQGKGVMTSTGFAPVLGQGGLPPEGE
jgi:hypothetical protein